MDRTWGEFSGRGFSWNELDQMESLSHCFWLWVKIETGPCQSHDPDCAQWSPTLWDPMDYSTPGFSIHGIPQARRPEWPSPSPGSLLNPGIKPRSLALHADSLPSESPGKPNHLFTYKLLVRSEYPPRVFQREYLSCLQQSVHLDLSFGKCKATCCY